MSEAAKKITDAESPPQPPPPPPTLLVRAIEVQRVTVAAETQGEKLLLTLPGEETVNEGVQDPRRFVNVAAKLSMGQWLEISNDAGNFWALMRVTSRHGGRGASLRGLSLQNIVQPMVADKVLEEPIPTEEWYVGFFGMHRKWCVITPKGKFFREGLNTESQARTILDHEAKNRGQAS